MQVSVSKGDELKVTVQGQLAKARTNQTIPDSALLDGARLVFFGSPEIVRARFPDLGERPVGLFRAGETPAVEFMGERFALEHMRYAEMRVIDLGAIIQRSADLPLPIPVDVDD